MIECYFRVEDFVFPGNGWTDFEWILDSWENEFRKLELEGYCELWFADGPYQLNIMREDTNQYSFEFIQRTDVGVSVEYSLTLGAAQSIHILARALRKRRTDNPKH